MTSGIMFYWVTFHKCTYRVVHPCKLQTWGTSVASRSNWAGIAIINLRVFSSYHGGGGTMLSCYHFSSIDDSMNGILQVLLGCEPWFSIVWEDNRRGQPSCWHRKQELLFRECHVEVPPLSAVYILESVCLVVSKAMYGTRTETLHFVKVRELCCKTSQYVSVGSGHPFLPTEP